MSHRHGPLALTSALAVTAALALAGCSDDQSSEGDGSTAPAASADWLDTDVCSLLPDGVLASIVTEDPDSVTPVPETAADSLEGAPEGVDANQVSCTWGEPYGDGVKLQLFDPPFPDLFTDTEAPGALTEPFEVEGGVAYVDQGAGNGCDLYLPSDPAWVTVTLDTYGEQPGSDAGPAESCDIAASIAVDVLADLGWEVTEG